MSTPNLTKLIEKRRNLDETAEYEEYIDFLIKTAAPKDRILTTMEEALRHIASFEDGLALTTTEYCNQNDPMAVAEIVVRNVRWARKALSHVNELAGKALE